MIFIEHFRKVRGWTLQRLGEELDPPASAGTIKSYESEERTPSVGRLRDIARALGVTPGALLDGPAPSVNDAVLKAVLVAVLKFAPNVEGSDSLAQNVAQSLIELLRLVERDPAILDNPGVLEGAARLAASRSPLASLQA